MARRIPSFVFASSLTSWRQIGRRVGGVVSPPADPVQPAPGLNAAQQFVQEGRAFYPGLSTDPDLAHFPALARLNSNGVREIIPPSQGGWPVVYWVPSGSTFTAPNGEYVHRSKDFNPESVTALKTAVTAHSSGKRIAVIKCPEKFVNPSAGIQISNMHGALIQGADIEFNDWIAGTTINAYRTETDAINKTNLAYSGKPRPGAWHYPPDEPAADPNNVHRQTVYAQGWTTTTVADQNPGMGFQWWEGLYMHGDYTFEGFNWNGANTFKRMNFLLGLSAARQDRVSVLMHPASSDKEPGGDFIQIFGGCLKYVERGATVAKTSYQAGFYQNHQAVDPDPAFDASGNPHPDRPRYFDVKYKNARAEMDYTTYGSVARPQQFAAPGRDGWGFKWPDYIVKAEEVYVWRTYSDGSPAVRSSIIGGDWPEVIVADHADFVLAPEVGLNYVSPELASTPRRATLETTGPTVPLEGMKTHIGSLTITAGMTIPSTVNMIVNADGSMVLENTIVKGYITVRADNVTIRQVIQSATSYTGTSKQFGIKCSDVKADGTPYVGLLVENTSIEVPWTYRNVYQGTGIAGGNYTLRNVQISGYVDGWGLFGTNGGIRRYADIDRVYVYDLPRYDFDPDQSDGSHGDGGQDQGCSGLRLTRSTIYGSSTSAVLVQQNQPSPAGGLPNHDYAIIDDNYLDLASTGGAVINISETSKGVVNNLTITNNEFGRTDPTRPRIIMPSTTRLASTTVLSNNRYADDQTPVTIANG